jgi:hypothetical protein
MIRHSLPPLMLSLLLCSPGFAAAPPLDPSEVGARAEALLQAARYAELEKMGADHWAQDRRVLGGNAALYHYYGALASSALVPVFSYRSGVPFEVKQTALERWAVARPKARQAKVALAQFWIAVAAQIRGDSFTDKVPPEVWTRHQYAVSQARALLGGVSDEDPHVYFARIDLSRASDDVRAQMDAAYAVAIERFPTYFHFYSQRATYLQERWYGKRGELAQFLQSLSTKPGGEAGLIGYSYAAGALMSLYPRQTLLKDTGLSWNAIKAGYAARERKYGLRKRDWNALLNLAPTGLDRATARQALEHIGSDWDPTVWQQKKYFDDVVAWAREEDAKVAVRIQWSFPVSFEHSAPTPHFKCTGKGEACEVEVSDWDPAVLRAERRRRLLAEVAPFAKDAVEPAPQVARYGAGAPIEYVTLTHRGAATEFRYMTRGFFHKGPAYVHFSHLANSLADRDRFLGVIHSAQPADAVLVVGRTLGAYAEVCAKLYPALAPEHQRVLDSSIFKSAAGRVRDMTTAQVKESLAKAPKSHRDRACEQLSRSVREGEESLRAN